MTGQRGREAGSFMANEVGTRGKEAVMAKFRYYPSICLDGLRKTMCNIRISSVLAEM
jgi:hypothetical protein